MTLLFMIFLEREGARKEIEKINLFKKRYVTLKEKIYN